MELELAAPPRQPRSGHDGDLPRVPQIDMPSVSGGVSTPTSATAAGGEVVSASLEGLVHALDGLKTSLGYDDFATVQSLIGDLRAENLELRSYAETAIRVRVCWGGRVWAAGGAWGRPPLGWLRI